MRNLSFQTIFLNSVVMRFIYSNLQNYFVEMYASFLIKIGLNEC